MSNAANCNAGYYAEGNVAGYGSISQSFAATPGSTLTLDYDFGSSDGSGYVVFNGATVPGSFAGVSPITHYSFNLGAALASNTLSFFGNNDPSYNFLDNVVVTASAATAAVPEPATWGLLLVGFGAAGASLRYRRRAARVAFAA